jgi:hypothetical protein
MAIKLSEKLKEELHMISLFLFHLVLAVKFPCRTLMETAGKATLGLVLDSLILVLPVQTADLG